MKNFRRNLLVLTVAILFACSALAQNGPRSALTVQAACNHLRAVVAKQLGANHGAEEYRCEDGTTASVNGYYVFSLRSNYPAPKGAGTDWVGSGLVGWYAVRDSDGQVRDWDVANLRLGTVIQ